MRCRDRARTSSIGASADRRLTEPVERLRRGRGGESSAFYGHVCGSRLCLGLLPDLALRPGRGLLGVQAGPGARSGLRGQIRCRPLARDDHGLSPFARRSRRPFQGHSDRIRARVHAAILKYARHVAICAALVQKGLDLLSQISNKARGRGYDTRYGCREVLSDGAAQRTVIAGAVPRRHCGFGPTALAGAYCVHEAHPFTGAEAKSSSGEGYNSR